MNLICAIEAPAGTESVIASLVELGQQKLSWNLTPSSYLGRAEVVLCQGVSLEMKCEDNYCTYCVVPTTENLEGVVYSID